MRKFTEVIQYRFVEGGRKGGKVRRKEGGREKVKEEREERREEVSSRTS